MQTQGVIHHIVAWLQDYCEESGMAGFVVGVSGGIDSAVTSALCARTGKPVRVLNMPIRQARDQSALAGRQIAWLTDRHDNVTGVEVDLTPAFAALEGCLPSEIQDGLAMANTRARLRMLTLYAFASHHRLLVAGTGNKVEDFGVGFFTKYGDGGVDLSPIADLMKSEVYTVARELEIDEAILTVAPTDGLWADGRTDESQIGASYAELEWAMTHMAAERDEAGLDARQKDVLAIFRRFRRANLHKMQPIPVCVIPAELR
ncbi:MAG: NAD(+) synthase [Kiritimatiellae bacterium]|nr:NAD(+) synthase [Kiritimatiellia bacterium]